MQIFESASDLIPYLNKHKKVASTIGLVPTMGALHEGHLSLVALSKAENSQTVVSIFVNPIQFTNSKDLELYPRPIDSDTQMLEAAGCDILFLPKAEEMYAMVPKTKMFFGYLEEVMEGAFRPGHFSGVGIIVSKLFNIVQPQNAYFGQKDLQQLAVVKQMVQDLSFPINIVSCPIIRESDGLAMSSRNKRLTQKNRPEAARINKALVIAGQKLENTPVQEVKKVVAAFISVSHVLTLEYFEIVDAETFLPVTNVKSHKTIALCIAVYLDEVRLIDNLILNPSI